MNGTVCYKMIFLGIERDISDIFLRFWELIENSDIENKLDILSSLRKLKEENKYKADTQYSRYNIFFLVAMECLKLILF